jgi:pimeloyl-ACP methyl ester carboxylesterase
MEVPHVAKFELCKTMCGIASLALWLAAASSPAWAWFPDWRRYLEIINPSSTTLQGTVQGYSAGPLPMIVVFYYDADDPQRGLLGSGATRSGGDFRFSVKAPGRYRIMAFEDLNGDLVLQSNEPVGICESPSPLVAKPGEALLNLFIRIQAPGVVAIPFRADAGSSASANVTADLGRYQMGQVVSLDDPRFSAANVRWGLWVPLEFLPDTGAGLYFLEEYSRDKMPILFVHGSGGNPTDFRTLIESLDRSRFQPWVYFYPTGMRLERQAELMFRIIAALQTRFEFRQMCILAHSMGGLVARGAISEAVRRLTPIEFPTFVTLSTPWQGHAGAEKGVAKSPAVVPAWRDMAPSSPFLENLWKIPLPKTTAYYLIFGYSGDFSLMINRNNDGAVSLASMLDPRAQTAARRIFGFNEDHGGILSSPGAARTVHTLLGRHETVTPWVERKVD